MGRGEITRWNSVLNTLRGRQLSPPEASQEWLARLQGLVDYWTKREQADAADALTLSGSTAIVSKHLLSGKTMPAFQARALEEQAQDPINANHMLLASAFHYCMQKGCRHSVLKQGRLYFKHGYRESPFLDRYFVLGGDHLVEFESVRRNIQKRPVPLSYHRRITSIRLRDVYLMTAESCSEFLSATQSKDGASFDPASDRNGLPRVYQDGLISLDNLLDCTFALWKQKAPGNPGKVAGLGRHGEAFVFQARSQLERDQWSVSRGGRLFFMTDCSAPCIRSDDSDTEV